MRIFFHNCRLSMQKARELPRNKLASTCPRPLPHSPVSRKLEKIEGQLASGNYDAPHSKSWAEFRKEYNTKILAAMGAGSRMQAEISLAHFECLAKPARLRSLTTSMIDGYIAKRRKEQSRKNGPTVSPATVNKELRTIRAVVRKAYKWGWLPKLPDFGFLREPGKLPTYVTPDHFAAIYQACDEVRWPDNQPCEAGDWWRALLVMAYMTGWRIGSLMALRRADVDLEAGFALSRAADNKGKRDAKIPLHRVVVDHLRKLVGFSPLMFPWKYGRRNLFDLFGDIQDAAGVKPEGGKPRYGFHDLRRAFATMNADNLTPDALQALMQHKDYQTTQRYINMARQLNPAVQTLFVPTLTARAAN